MTGTGVRRTWAVLASLGLLLACTPALAAPRYTAPGTREAAALRLLDAAATASREQPYHGTKYVASWRPGGATAALVDVRHDPGTGTVVTRSPTAAGIEDDDALVLAATRVDDGLLDVLADRYDLRVAGRGRCAGRAADVVEASRPGGDLAARFWLDRETGLLLRRDVYDDDGRRLRSSAFVDLVTGQQAGAPAGRSPQGRVIAAAAGRLVAPRRVPDLRDAGWPVPAELPGGFALFEARMTDDRVLHLAYSDGLSTTSLFVQQGEPGHRPPDGFERREVSGQPVWWHNGAPERVVWSGGGRVWTLVSDASPGAVHDAVEGLPHDPMPEPGLRARLSRGLSRLAGWLNPLD